MKVRAQHDEYTSGPLSTHDVVWRLEALLSLWKRPPPWHRWPDDDSAPTSPGDLERWEALLARASVVEPVSTLSGLLAAIRRHNARLEAGEKPLTLDLAQSAGIARVAGPKAGTRSQVGLVGPTLRTVTHAWLLSVPCTDEEADDQVRTLCRDHFAVVEHADGAICVGEPRHMMTWAATVLARLAGGSADEQSLARLWRLAHVFGIAAEWIQRLESSQRPTLANALAAELSAATSALGWLDDLRFDHFAAGAVDPKEPTRTVFASRVDEHLTAERELHHSQQSLMPKDVFGAMATGIVNAGHSVQIGNCLSGLPPGRTFLTAIDELRRRRPELIASLLNHPAFAADAMFAITGWPDFLVIQGHGEMQLRSEWQEVMALSRRLILFPQQSVNYAGALALASRDEAFARDDGNPLRRSSTPPLAVRTQPWEERLASAEHATAAVDVMVGRLALSPSDADFIVALRLLAVVETRYPTLASRLALACLNAYEARVAFGEPRAGGPPDLASHAELLVVFGGLLKSRAPDAYSRWETPFDLPTLVARSNDPAPDVISGGTPFPRLDHAGFVHDHVRNLLAAAAKASDPMVGELAAAVVRLFEATHAKMGRDPWSWMQHAAADIEPQFVSLARVLARIPVVSATELLDRLIDAKATALHLTQLLWGFRDAHSPLVSHIEGRAKRDVAQLAARRLAPGHAAALSVSTYYAGLLPFAERFASKVLDSLKNEPSHIVGAIRDRAVQVRVASLVGQKAWDRLDAVQDDVSDRSAKLLVSNLRAVADLERGQSEEAIARLESVLQRAPQDRMALVNLAVAHAARSDWAASAKACRTAIDVLADSAPDVIHAHQARAEYNLGNFRKAADALERIRTDVGQQPWVIALRISLAMVTEPTRGALESDLERLAQVDPAAGDALRARVATLPNSELAGAWFGSGSLARRFPTFEERCAAHSEEPENLVLKNLASAGQRLTEQPALAVHLDEDQLTRLLCAFLVTLERYRVHADTLVSGGWGPKKEGLADFALSEIGDGSRYGRRIVRGEAKLWKGPEWMKKGLEQIFATSTSGQELFLTLVIYSKKPDFGNVVAKARSTVTTFGKSKGNPFATIDYPTDVPHGSGTGVRVLRTLHGKTPTILYTLIIDVRSEPSRVTRQGGQSAKKATGAKKSGSASSSKKQSGKKKSAAVSKRRKSDGRALKKANSDRKRR